MVDVTSAHMKRLYQTVVHKYIRNQKRFIFALFVSFFLAHDVRVRAAI